MPSYPMFIADAFTSKAFAGNAAAVCLLPAQPEGVDDVVMQKIAAEMNLSETAYVQPYPEDEAAFGGEVFARASRFRLRWFSPAVEVPLCGHATMASATVLFRARGNKSDVICFATLSGQLTAALGPNDSVVMELPLNPPVEGLPEGVSPSLIDAAIPSEDVHSIHYSKSSKKLLIRVKDDLGRDYIEKLKVQPKTFVQLHDGSVVRGMIVTVGGNCEGYDFVSRYFAPWVAIDEDPVTGSAHTVLAPYWAGVRQKNTFTARQCSARGGDMSIELLADRKIVKIAGQGTLVLTGMINF